MLTPTDSMTISSKETKKKSIKAYDAQRTFDTGCINYPCLYTNVYDVLLQ